MVQPVPRAVTATTIPFASEVHRVNRGGQPSAVRKGRNLIETGIIVIGTADPSGARGQRLAKSRVSCDEIACATKAMASAERMLDEDLQIYWNLLVLVPMASP